MKKVWLLFIFCACTVQAQISKDYKETPLQQVLNDLSKSYNLIFSFSNDIVKNKVVTLAIHEITIAKLLPILTKITDLNFKQISARQVIVSAPSTRIEVCGYLYDQLTNTPLSFASILIENKNTGTITDENGFFQLGNIDQDIQILLQHVGYKDKKIKASDLSESGCPRIPVSIESTALEEILIIQYITKGLNKNIDGSFGLNKEDLGILPGQTESDILQSIQLIPGINSPDETATGIQIRGGSADQNLILWDNIKMYNAGHFFGMLSAFNPNVVNSAKIFKGGTDPKYGDRISGVIDISSDTKIPEKFKGGVGINGTHGDLFIKTPFGDNVGIIVSGRRSYTDLIKSPTYKSISKKVFQNTKIEGGPKQDPSFENEEGGYEQNISENNFFFYDTSAKLIIDASKNDKIMVSSIYSKNDLAFEINDDEDFINDDLDIQNQGFSISWEGNKGKKIDHSLIAYYSKYDSDYLFTEREESILEERSIRKNTVEDIGADFNFTYDITQKNSITLGYQFSNNEVFYAITRESEFETPIDETNLVKNYANSVYANYKFLPENKSFINLGLRASHYSTLNRFYIEPRVNVEYPINNLIRFKATGELRHQSISQLVEFEDTQLRLENNIWIHANDAVPVLKSLQFSTGFLLSKNDWSIEVDGYYKNIDGLTSITNGFNTATIDLSTGESRIIGLDLLLRKKIKNFRIWLGYTLSDIEYTFPEIQENPFSGNNDITHNFRISNTLKVKNWEFSLGWLWRSGTPFTDAELINDDILFGAANANRLPAYHRLDFSAIYRFNINKSGGWRGQLGASLRNIYNRVTPISISYETDEGSTSNEIELKAIQQRSMRITPNLIFRMYF